MKPGAAASANNPPAAAGMMNPIVSPTVTASTHRCMNVSVMWEPPSLHPADALGQRLKFTEDQKLLFIDLREFFNFTLRLHIGVVVVLGHGRSDSVLALGCDQQDGALKTSEHR